MIHIGIYESIEIRHHRAKMSSFQQNNHRHKSFPQTYLKRQHNAKMWKNSQLPEDFHWYVYREHNHDLFLHNIRTREQLENHWITRGNIEKRSYHWDIREYRNIYSRVDKSRLPPLTKRYNKIIMITQFFLSPNEERNREIQQVLKENCENPEIDEIHLLNEQYYDLPLLQHAKIRQFNLGKRMSYYDAFFYSHTNLGRDSVKIVCNNDMTYDAADLRCLRYYNFYMKKVMCLLRYEKTREGRTHLSHTLVRDGKAFSADTWIYEDINPSKQMDFYLGLLACDIRIAKLLETHHYIPINPCLSIRSYHNHFSGFRKSSQATRVKGEYKRLDVLLDEEIERIREELTGDNSSQYKDIEDTGDIEDSLTSGEKGKKIYQTNAKQWVLQDNSAKLWKHIVNILYLNQWKTYIEQNDIFVIYLVSETNIHSDFINRINRFLQTPNIVIKTANQLCNDMNPSDIEIKSHSLTEITFNEFIKNGEIIPLARQVIEKYGKYWIDNGFVSDNHDNPNQIVDLLYEDAEFPIRCEMLAKRDAIEALENIDIVVIVDVEVMKEEMNQWIACIRKLSQRYKLITTVKIANDIPSYGDFGISWDEMIGTFYKIPHYITFTEKNEYYMNVWNVEINEQVRKIFIYADYRNITQLANHEIEYEAVLLTDIVNQEISSFNNDNLERKIYYFTDSIL